MWLTIALIAVVAGVGVSAIVLGFRLFARPPDGFSLPDADVPEPPVAERE